MRAGIVYALFILYMLYNLSIRDNLIQNCRVQVKSGRVNSFYVGCVAARGKNCEAKTEQYEKDLTMGQ